MSYVLCSVLCCAAGRGYESVDWAGLVQGLETGLQQIYSQQIWSNSGGPTLDDYVDLYTSR